MALLTLLGWALRLALLDAFPLREDEALYAVWARRAAADPFYLSTWPDKPPLFLWLQALALRFFGAGAPGARLVSILASTASLPLAAAAARRLWPRAPARAATAAAALLALSPFAIAFAPTGYTDSLLLFWGLLALALALRGRYAAAGAALGAAVMTKQQGLLFVPLIAAVPLVQPSARRGPALAALAAGAALLLLPLLAWDAVRWATAPSPWDLGARNYGALALAPLAALPERVRDWAEPFGYLAAAPWAWALLAGATGAAFLLGARRGWPLRLPLLLALWALGFLLLHLLITVQPWDRYLLPLAAALALLAAGGVALTPRAAPYVLTALLLLLLLPQALAAARGAYPIGADHGDLTGLDAAFAWVDEQAAPATLYHRTLGWQAQFALYDAVEEGRVALRWFPHAVALADDATKQAQRTRLVIELQGREARDLPVQLAARGLALEPRFRSGHVTLSAIVARDPAAACGWCACRLPAWGEGWGAGPADPRAQSTAP